MSKNIWDMSLKEASTRPEFYQFMTLGLKDLLFDAYKKAPTTYAELVTFTTSVKDKEGYPSLGNVSLPEQVNEGEPFPEKAIPKQDFVEVTNIKIGEIIAITRELIDDERTGQIKRMPMDLGSAHAKKEDKSVYSVIVANATIYDAQALFSLNHPGYTGGAAIAANDNLYTAVTLSANAIAVALSMVALWTGHTSEDILDVTPRLLLVPKRLRYTAHVLTQTQFLPMAYAAGVLGPAAAGGIMAKSFISEQALGIVSSARLDTSTSGTALTDWYVWTDFPGLIFQWRDKLELLQEDVSSYPNFERDVYRWKSRERIGLKPVNWRVGMLVS